jgi:hypothetical protein
MIYICHPGSRADDKIAYAKAHLAELLAQAARGEHKFGTDPRALDEMTDEEADAFLEGR